jgi:uncharacterized protein (DUF1919 family)
LDAVIVFLLSQTYNEPFFGDFISRVDDYIRLLAKNYPKSLQDHCGQNQGNPLLISI